MTKYYFHASMLDGMFQNYTLRHKMNYINHVLTPHIINEEQTSLSVIWEWNKLMDWVK